MSDDLQFHPVANIFPMMNDHEFASLVEDIAGHGLREAIWLHRDGRIIDGRNRYLACRKAGVSCDSRVFEGKDHELVGFVVSQNLHRRQLKPSQGAMVAAKIANMSEGRPRETDSIESVSLSNAAQLLNVSRSSVQRAREVRSSGIPELIALVESGGLPVNSGFDVAREPEDEQRRITALEGKTAIRSAVRQLRENRKKPPSPKTPGRRRKVKPVIEGALSSVTGSCLALEEIDKLDDSLTNEEAGRWLSDLSKSIRELNRIRNLLKEHST